MRHPLIRILLAAFVAFWSPLCCCQAAAIIGAQCSRGDHETQATVASACCCKCGNECSDSGRDKTSAHDSPTDRSDCPDDPGGCPSCPSCKGTAGGAGLWSSVKLHLAHDQVNAAASSGLSALPAISMLVAEPVPALAGFVAPRAHPRANRAAQRWHCALNL